MAEHPDAIGPEVLPRFRAGAEITGTEYALARRTQAEWTRALTRLFETVDLLALPATPVPALPLADSDALKAAALLTRFTRVFNLAGVPALSLPCGFTSLGLPIGLQIVGPAWAEARVLRLAGAYEAATEWHTRRPAL
jgi:aspartyl-tRNA(Asn)/glutamyl-tRNA(Gln) amidotransferase subunit A